MGAAGIQKNSLRLLCHFRPCFFFFWSMAQLFLLPQDSSALTFSLSAAHFLTNTRMDPQMGASTFANDITCTLVVKLTTASVDHDKIGPLK